MVIDCGTGRIVRTAFSRGRAHDITLLKESGLPIGKDTTIYADLGYLGIADVHKQAKVFLPQKASKLHKLTKEQRQQNRQQRSIRIKIEHCFAIIKRFKVFTTPYRNRRSRFTLRFNLFAAISNRELEFLHANPASA